MSISVEQSLVFPIIAFGLTTGFGGVGLGDVLLDTLKAVRPSLRSSSTSPNPTPYNQYESI